ncbi:putative cellulose synthase [Helianthus annuus]|uniref:Cellulose synthase n=1 Tax=Helianthus annuus TaxID=4232 RepID=A0A251SRB7_HELAN|nr:probable cellulose synthase A catalytic subunit 8 [UDP-forming] [Helianthus annuus]KAF5772882.1 putative cellulose synthase [Helianthus annuus]KAJ0476448.1 putative cellulose synthase [Helianthus annuus]KAJ0497275.1 putative cellulose synthase [Helianthus annuus]KAJ0663284.1 putative cellulose synthase [Helianthus annuus]KAJ0857702.1 putative cellulose synthase [Helianthus annuus]
MVLLNTLLFSEGYIYGFFAEDVHLVASASIAIAIYVWKITEGTDEDDKPQIGEGESVHPQVCWHCHKQVGWIYGSVTEVILIGFKMNCHGRRSVFCVPKRAASRVLLPLIFRIVFTKFLGGLNIFIQVFDVALFFNAIYTCVF